MPRSCATRGFTLLVFLIAACAFFPGPPLCARQAQAPAKLLLDLDLSTYKAALDRIWAAVQHREDIPQLRQSLPRIWHVRTSDGVVDVSTVWLASELQKLEQEPAKYDMVASGVRSQLAAMRKSATELEAALQQPSSPGAREHLDKILDRREFAGERGPSQMELFQARMARWIERQLFRLLSRLHLGAQAGNAVSWGIIAIAFFALCYWIVQNLPGRSRLQQPSQEVAARWNDSRAWAQDA